MGLNEVFKKVADIQPQVSELANHKVELALLDDLKKLTSALEKNYSEFAKNKSALKSIAADLKGRGNTIMGDFNKITNLLRIFEKQAKELGINYNSIPAVQDANELNFDLNDVEDTLASINNIR